MRQRVGRCDNSKVRQYLKDSYAMELSSSRRVDASLAPIGQRPGTVLHVEEHDAGM